MNERLTPEAEEQLRALARKISVAHELDPELQEELYGHLEDKALGYLTGEEAVSVEDAILLTSKHFGDPRVLKSWLSSVHIRGTGVAMMKRWALIALAMLVIDWLLGAVAASAQTHSFLWVFAVINFPFGIPHVWLELHWAGNHYQVAGQTVNEMWAFVTFFFSVVGQSAFLAFLFGRRRHGRPEKARV